MEDKLIIAVIAAISAIAGGVISAVIAPFIKHWLEQASTKKTRQREQIQKWRQMLLDVDRVAEGNISPGPQLQVHPDFLSLEPHLSEDTRRSVYGENRTLVVGQSLALPLQKVKQEIARIEREWGVQE
jgi:hypothetical protein